MKYQTILCEEAFALYLKLTIFLKNINNFIGDDFIKDNFNKDTILNSKAVLSCNQSSSGLKEVSFTDNRCFGFENLFGRGVDSGILVNRKTPLGVS